MKEVPQECFYTLFGYVSTKNDMPRTKKKTVESNSFIIVFIQGALSQHGGFQRGPETLYGRPSPGCIRD